MIQHVLRALLACFDQLLQYLLYGVVHKLCRLQRGEEDKVGRSGREEW